jgi:hypothetical protein
MGRHGTGGSDGATEQGSGRSDDSQEGDFRITAADRTAQWDAVPDPTAKSTFWDSVDESRASDWPSVDQPQAPGWPELPDSPGVTGQWAPLPERRSGDAPRAPQSDPFEQTGAFSPPVSRSGTGSAPPAGQPFETTGAFTRPSHWDAPGEAPDSTQTFGIPPTSDSGRDAFGSGNDLQGSGTNPFGSGVDLQGSGTNPFGRGADPQGSGTNPFGSGVDLQGSGTNPFGPGVDPQVSGTDPFMPRTDPFGPGKDSFGPGTDPFGAAKDPLGSGTAPYGAGGSSDTHVFGSSEQAASGGFGFPGDATQTLGAAQGPAPFEQTQHPQVPAEPPEPGDVRVYGNATLIDAPAPDWSERENGFLGSGWSSDEPKEADAPSSRRRGRRKPPPPPGDGGFDEGSGGRRGRMALLSVAAVVVVLGGTVAGVKLMSGSSSPEQCTGATCAAVQGSNQPKPLASSPEEETEEPSEEPVEEPAEAPTDEEASPTGQPTPRSTATASTPRRTSSPEPKPTKSRRATAEPTPDDDASGFEEPTASETPTEDTTTIDDIDNGPTSAPPADPAPTATATAAPLAGGQAVNLNFNVVQQGLSGYTAQVDVVNTSAEPLAAPTLSVPVEGRVLDVQGAEWSQDGELLIIDVSGALGAGESAEVVFSATGAPARPATCGLIGGECAIL